MYAVAGHMASAVGPASRRSRLCQDRRDAGPTRLASATCDSVPYSLFPIPLTGLATLAI